MILVACLFSVVTNSVFMGDTIVALFWGRNSNVRYPELFSPNVNFERSRRPFGNRLCHFRI